MKERSAVALIDADNILINSSLTPTTLLERLAKALDKIGVRLSRNRMFVFLTTKSGGKANPVMIDVMIEEFDAGGAIVIVTRPLDQAADNQMRALASYFLHLPQIETIAIASGDNGFIPFLKFAGKTGKRIVVAGSGTCSDDLKKVTDYAVDLVSGSIEPGGRNSLASLTQYVQNARNLELPQANKSGLLKIWAVVGALKHSKLGTRTKGSGLLALEKELEQILPTLGLKDFAPTSKEVKVIVGALIEVGVLAHVRGTFRKRYRFEEEDETAKFILKNF